MYLLSVTGPVATNQLRKRRPNSLATLTKWTWGLNF